jgi:hypothetical protein
MQKSKFFKLGFRDYLKGSIKAILTGITTALALNTKDIKEIGTITLCSLLTYLAVNLFTNSNDEILTPENNELHTTK